MALASFSPAHRESVGRDIPKTAAAFMKSRANPRTIRKRLMTVCAKNETAQVEAHAYANSDEDLAGDIYAAQASRKQTVHAANVWKNSRSSGPTEIMQPRALCRFDVLRSRLDGVCDGFRQALPHADAQQRQIEKVSRLKI